MLDTATVAVIDKSGDDWPNPSVATVLAETIGEAKVRLDAARSANAAAQQRLDIAKSHLEAKIAELKIEWLKEERNALLEQAAEAAKRELEYADDHLRSNLIAWYFESNEKTFDEHLSVRVNTKLDYRVEKATEWAKQNAPFILTVDKKEFDRIAKVQDLHFVKKSQVPSAVVSKSFSAEQG